MLISNNFSFNYEKQSLWAENVLYPKKSIKIFWTRFLCNPLCGFFNCHVMDCIKTLLKHFWPQEKKKKTFKITKKKKKPQKSINDQSIVKTSKMPLNHLK